MIINTNTSASLASYNLNKTKQDHDRSLTRLSSGSRINSSFDDAAGLAVSMKMDAQIRNLSALDKNMGNALSFMETQDGALRKVADILRRIDELETLKKDVTKNAGDIELYDAEINSLTDEFANIRESRFNGIRLFSEGVVADSIPASTLSLDSSTVDLIRPPLPSSDSNVASPEVVLLIDVSGSMLGAKINSVAANIKSLVDSLNSNSTVNEYTIKIIGYQNNLRAQIHGQSSVYKIDKNSDVNAVVSNISNDILNLPWSPVTYLPTIPGHYQGETIVESLEYIVDSVWENKNKSNLKIIAFTDEPPTDTGQAKLDSVASMIKANDKISLDIFKDSTCDQPLEVPYDPLMVDLINKSGATAHELDSSLPNLGSIFSNMGTTFSGQYVEVTTNLVAGYISQNGATQSALHTVIDRTKTNILNLTSAKSRILDVDMAQESIQLARKNVLMEAGNAMLAQANQKMDSILRLIQLN